MSAERIITLALLLLLPGPSRAAETRPRPVVPARVSASSSFGESGQRPRWHVDSLRLGAKHYVPSTGSNAPFGLTGVSSCNGAAKDARGVGMPRHADYVSETAEHPKPEGMWMSAKGDVKAAWIEFELPRVTPLKEIWIWNWNDGPEVGRRVRRLTIQTSSKSLGDGKLGSVEYDMTHETVELPDIGRVDGRTPDVVFKFPRGVRSRYLRLHELVNFGDEEHIGLAEVFIFAAGEPAKGDAGESAEREELVADPVDLTEPRWNLFLDDHAVARTTGFRRVVHHPQPRGVVLKPDKPWETYGVVPEYVGRRADGTYECYYQTIWINRGGGGQNAMAYAVSDDGVHWRKPVLNLVDAPSEIEPRAGYPLGVSTGQNSKANNLIPCGHPRDMWRFGNVRDPNKRYAMSTNFGAPARVAFCRELPDFINDPNWRDKLVASGGYKPSHYNALEFWDDQHGEWVAMRQAPNHPPVRCGGRYASPDLKHWKLEHYLYPDAHDSTDPRRFDEVYGIMSIHVEGMAIGFLHWFIGDRTHPNPNLYEDGHNGPTTDEGLIGKSVAKGTMEVRVATSRDGGMTWNRAVSREAWIPHGAEHDSYDRLVRLDCPPLRRGDEDWFYCYVYDGDHATGRGLYRDRRASRIQGALYVQKHNRYVSLSTGNIPQILITQPIKVTGDTLQLNADASRGEITVGIGVDKVIDHAHGAWTFKAKLPHWMVRDRWRRSHLEKGFGLEDCAPIRENCIEHEVKFKKATLAQLKGKTVRLYIRARDTDLYGFRFK